eukprot:Protomagalhaensia_wolfi_Nauph_80__2550@NODE_2709_length_1010_cov_9_217302_g2121_i0_p1_GENE_NODE_2709_length_1010_cov_9_217302_g2121_i0NODE_2709_length_1010_cov_9_217302_g2121_i0_p1_ORF_typecomplete_len103_score6_30_NODE_2709_length_1010_cov_9_217302_g2121_i0537845
MTSWNPPLKSSSTLPPNLEVSCLSDSPLCHLHLHYTASIYFLASCCFGCTGRHLLGGTKVLGFVKSLCRITTTREATSESITTDAAASDKSPALFMSARIVG